MKQTGASAELNRALSNPREYPNTYSLHREDGTTVSVFTAQPDTGAGDGEAQFSRWYKCAYPLMRAGGVLVRWLHGMPANGYTLHVPKGGNAQP